MGLLLVLCSCVQFMVVDIAISGSMDREDFSNYQSLAQQQTPKVHDNDFDSKSFLILTLLWALWDYFWFSVLVCSSWWLLVLTPGSALPLFWGFSLGKHLQFVMWQIWYNFFKSVSLTVSIMLQYQHRGASTHEQDYFSFDGRGLYSVNMHRSRCRFLEQYI